MCANRILLAGLLLGGMAVAAIAQNAGAQGWQPVRSQTSRQAASDENPVTPVNWEERVSQRPQQPLQWQPSRQPTTQSTAYQASNMPIARSTSQTAKPYPAQTARRSVFDRENVFDNTSAPAEPVAKPTPEPEVIPRGEEMAPHGATQFEPVADEGTFAGPMCGVEGQCFDGCGTCGDRHGQPASDQSCEFRYEIFDGSCGGLRNLTLAAGVQGFKGPMDRGVNGNFGFNEGINFGGPLGDPWGCGYQIGANFLQSDLSNGQQVTVGNNTLKIPERNQTFITAAIFRRAKCTGLQWGVAYDYLHDSYFQEYDLQQIRSETGLVLNDTYEIGYYGAYGVSSARFSSENNSRYDWLLNPTDMFVVYVRRNFENSGDGRVWAGASGSGDGLVGADLWVPLGRNFALSNRINYLIPNNSSPERESWGLMMQLVWYPGRMALCQHKNPYRPMFNVADNSLFMVDRLTTQTSSANQ
jgi:hypothetical protein